ncbi:MAG: radical SAM protein [Desulfovibrio sp.]|nr:radical SAM protein [Desulfovibrio sp.]
MRFCPKIFNEINLEPAHISPCCNIRGLQTPVFPYSGGEIDMNAYAAFLQKTADELQTDSGLCRGCPDLESAAQPRTYGISFHAVSINMHRYFCNCKCVYCGLWQDRKRKEPYDPLPGLKSLRNQDALAENCVISWGGGEPSILPTFDASCDWALENGYYQYIHTNALRFSPAIARAIRRKRTAINISLDSSSPAAYKRVKGLDGFQKVTDSLKKYAEYDPGALTLKYIIFEENNSPAEVAGFIRLCKALNVAQAQYSLDFRETNSRKVSEKTLTTAAFMIKQAQALGVECVPSFIDRPWLEKINAIAESI